MKAFAKLPTDQLTRSVEFSISTYANEVIISVIDDMTEYNLLSVHMDYNSLLELIGRLKVAERIG